MSETLEHPHPEIRDESDTTGDPGDYILYKRRFIIINIAALMNFTNASLMCSFAPNADETAAYFQISTLQVNMLSNIFPITFIPVFFIAGHFIELYGLKPAMIFAAGFDASGAFLRVASCYAETGSVFQYFVLFSGTFISAIAQVFIGLLPIKAATYWFSPKGRPLANAFGALSNTLGIAISDFLSPSIVSFVNARGSDQGIRTMLYVWSIPTLVPLLLCTVFFYTGSYPPTPPSRAAATRSLNFRQSLPDILRTRQFLVLAILFGINYGLIGAFTTLLEEILCPNGYSDTFAGASLGVAIVSGLIGAVLFNRIAGHHGRLENTFKFCYVMSILGVICIGINVNYPDNGVLIMLSLAVFGFFAITLVPLTFELSIECCYPCSEAASCGLVLVCSKVIIVILVLFLPLTSSPISAKQELIEACADGYSVRNMMIPTQIMAVIGTASTLVCILVFKSPNKRYLREISFASDQLNTNY